MYPMPKSQALYVYMRHGLPYPTFVKDERAEPAISFGPNPLFVFTEESCNMDFPFPLSDHIDPPDLKFVPINGVSVPILVRILKYLTTMGAILWILLRVQ